MYGLIIIFFKNIYFSYTFLCDTFIKLQKNKNK